MYSPNSARGLVAKFWKIEALEAETACHFRCLQVGQSWWLAKPVEREHDRDGNELCKPSPEERQDASPSRFFLRQVVICIQ